MDEIVGASASSSSESDAPLAVVDEKVEETGSAVDSTTSCVALTQEEIEGELHGY